MKRSGEGAKRDIRKEAEEKGGRGRGGTGGRVKCLVPLPALCTQWSSALSMHHCKMAQDPCKKDEACSQAVLFFSNWRHCHEVKHYGSQLTTPTTTPLIAWAPVILSLLLFLLFSEIRQNKEILTTGAHSNKLIGMERKECKVRAILKTMTSVSNFLASSGFLLPSLPSRRQTVPT